MQNYSRQREAIVRFLANTTSHPTAEEIYEEVRKSLPKISLATVYRNLRLLEKEKEILVLHTDDNKERFDAKIFPHAHLFCKDCGKVCDVTLEESTLRILRSIVPEAEIELNFYGTCDKCNRSIDGAE